MDTQQIAVISQTVNLGPAALARATAAIQQQVANDFAPVWGVTATVADYPTLEGKPPGSWPVVLRDDIGTSAWGVHLTGDGERAFALVAIRDDNWSISLSHEILEMLADPLGVRFPFGPSPNADGANVEYLAEVCDPCRGNDYGYPIDDVRVSDFVRPAFYDGFGSGRYDFRGHITQPRELLAGGYYAWRDLATRQWWYTTYDGESLTSKSLGLELPAADVHLRGAIDRRMTDVLAAQAVKRKAKSKSRSKKKPARAEHSPEEVRRAQAQWWQAEIDRVRHG